MCIRDRVIIPQELILDRLLTKQTPISFIPDFKLGVRRKDLARKLCQHAGVKTSDCKIVQMERIRTESWASTETGISDIFRGRPPRPLINAQTVKAAAKEGAKYVLRSLAKDNKFLYKLQPVSGKGIRGDYSLPRHAGTTWFLLQAYRETGQIQYLQSAERALDFLAGLMTENSLHQALSLIHI